MSTDPLRDEIRAEMLDAGVGCCYDSVDGVLDRVMPIIRAHTGEAAYLRGRDEVRATVRALEDRITALEAELRAATVRHGGGQG